MGQLTPIIQTARCTRALIPGAQTQYGYDILRNLEQHHLSQLRHHESFVNDDSLGDVTSHTDGNGNATTFQYNNRRELTNTIAPTNVVTSVAYDPNDNVASTTDARGNVTSNTWSATRHLLTTTLPTFAAGTPVLTHVYDNRDWLSETLDPYKEPTLYTNNPAGLAGVANRPVAANHDVWLSTPTAGKLPSPTPRRKSLRQTWDARGELIATDRWRRALFHRAPTMEPGTRLL